MRKSASPALDVRKQLQKNGRMYTVYSLEALRDYGYEHIEILPYSIRILLENLLRNAGTEMVRRQDIDKLASWHPDMTDPSSIAFMPGRVVLQDFTGVPALVDLAALRSAVARSGGNPAALNPFVPADLIIDHSVQVDFFGTQDALARNVEREMERNRERYSLLRWGQQAFTRFQVVPPGTGIVHQVNLEYLASVVQKNTGDDETILYPDTVLGTDSHTTMINGLGVLGWGVGGIEAEAVLLGQPYFMQIPEVVGVRLTGRLREGVTATDLVLTITQYLRAKGVVGRFVEFFGTGAGKLALPDRATIANMAPEYGATMGYFPVDEQTLAYLLASGRDKKQVELVEWYMNEQGLFRTASSPEPVYSVVYTIDLGQVEPSLAGPEKPQKRIALSAMASTFSRQLPPAAAPSMEGENNGGCWADEGGACDLTIPDCGCPEVSEDGHRLGCFEVGGQQMLLSNGAVVIAAITSCTNTSNPAVMIGAGLLARQAVKLGLQVKPWVKTSLAPGSRVVSRYLEDAGLLDPLQSLGFYIVGYGCTTCIGNSGPLDLEIARIIKQKKLLAAAVLSGNRNFQARIHPLVRANYLCSPLLVVAYALAGSMMIDLVHDPLGLDADGYPVYFKDILPTDEEIETVVKETVTPQLFSSSYSGVFSGNESWNGLQVPAGKLFSWDTDSSYIREPPFFKDLPATPRPVSDINDAAILAIFGDTVTTDHISPAGAIPVDSPAGKYLQKQGVAPENFNSFGSRRGNHQVMMRGTFGNIRIRNLMVEREGGFTHLMPEGTMTSIFDAAMAYKERKTPLVILAGEDYGTGSSRDWAAKGTLLLGVKAVFAKSFERIHRSNLIGMGVLPLQFKPGEDAGSLGINGSEQLSIQGLSDQLSPGGEAMVTVTRDGEPVTTFSVSLRLDNEMEVEYYRHGGILHKVLRRILTG